MEEKNFEHKLTYDDQELNHNKNDFKFNEHNDSTLKPATLTDKEEGFSQPKALKVLRTMYKQCQEENDPYKFDKYGFQLDDNGSFGDTYEEHCVSKEALEKAKEIALL